ncbi:hypothetical protein [Arthrobacter sp. ISL-69]|uniref:hypothetical protein n=1 Tax=Arthrobacter sp. ISL-69 TaxID=2819113 RepID=UPI001BEB26CE|nr:hypothetical protein [Arthrobacter sp. ISL-69]MBT2536287.1 hypothetical protein [Arthrobacter sp. ISL-69]
MVAIRKLFRSIWSGLIGLIQDRPAVLSGLAPVLVLMHAILTRFALLPDVWSGLVTAERPDALALYLGVAGSSSLVAGFSGVVIVFGLTAGGSRFQLFRARSGQALRSNWISTMAASFAAAGLSLAAAVANFVGAQWLAPWIVELALLLLLHSALRLLWLMKRLMNLVKTNDAEEIDKSNVVPIPPFQKKSQGGPTGTRP